MNEWIVILLIWKSVLMLVGIPAENYYNHGNDLYELGDFVHAEYYYKKSFARTTLTARAFYNAGNAAYLQGNYIKAIEYYESSLDIISEDEDAWHNLELARRKVAKETPRPAVSSGGNRTQRPPKLANNKSNSSDKTLSLPQSTSQTDQVLARARRREEVLYRFQNTSLYKKQAVQQTRDIFTQSPEEIVKTMRKMTKAGYPFRPGTSLKKAAPIQEKIDW